MTNTKAAAARMLADAAKAEYDAVHEAEATRLDNGCVIYADNERVRGARRHFYRRNFEAAAMEHGRKPAAHYHANRDSQIRMRKIEEYEREQERYEY